MKIPIVIPQIGQSIAEATILKWYKKPGDTVSKGESLLEIGTDKINTELPSPESGVLREWLVQEGETVPVLTEIAMLESDNPSSGTPVAKSDPVVAAAGPVVKPSEPGAERVHLSPVVRKLAIEHGIDVEKVLGTGAGGRITREDILKAVNEKPAKVVKTVDSDIERVPMSRMRKLIADHMAASRRTAADVTTFFEIDMSEVDHQRKLANEKLQSSAKLTYLPFVLVAVARALRAFPIVNASIENDHILYRKKIHIGVAVALEDGLIVPVIKNADTLDVVGIARTAQDLSERARSKRLNATDLEGGTFTVTNPGVFGALMGTPIIHQPQVAILGVGAVTKRPTVVQDSIVIRPQAYFSLSYDHRAMDGATADRFLGMIKNILENECPVAAV